MRISALLMAAGRGIRFGAELPKQYLPLLGRPVIRHAAEALLRDGLVDRILPVCAVGEEGRVAAALDGLPAMPTVAGGETRQASVRAGLEALAGSPPDLVLVHDAARPFLSPALISRAIAAGKKTGAAIPAVEVTDTIKRVDSGDRVV